MHLVINYEQMIVATAWADDIYPTEVKADWYNDQQELIEANIDVYFKSNEICNFNDQRFKVVSIDRYFNHASYTDANKGIAFLQPA